MRLLNKITILICVLVPCFLRAGNPNEIAQQVLDKLYQVNGHFNPRKPRLEISKSTNNVAMYIKSKNTIQLEEQAYQLCQSFGKDSLNALAFLLGHELIHAIQINNVLPKSSFISYDRNLSSSLEIEQNADVQGIFISYLAGFRTIQLIPQIIDKMYTVYELRKKNIKGYPTEDERKSSYKTVIAQANQLIELFHLSNEFSIIQEFQASIQCLEYIAKFYQGKEIYNNLGVNMALMALNFTSRNAESYIYPLELDWSIRIKKPKTGRGEEQMDTIEKQAQNQLFLKAKDYLRLASELDPGYLQADVNIFTVLIMMNDLQNAKQFYQKELRNVSAKSPIGEFTSKIKLANAILLAKSNKITEAKKIWSDLLNDKNPIIAVQSEQNLSSLTKIRPNKLKKSDSQCIEPDLSDVPEINNKLRSVKTEAWIQMDSINKMEKKQINTTSYYTSYVNDSRILNIQKIMIPPNHKMDPATVSLYSLGNNQWVYHCRPNHEAYVLNDQYEIVQLIRYRHYKEVD